MCRDCDYGDYKYIANEPKHPYEIIDESFNKTCVESVRAYYKDWYNDWLRDTASEYFDTSEWDDCWWSAWKDYIEDIV